MMVPKVNPEIWEHLYSAKRKSDLRLSNIQQSLQHATFALLKSCDLLLPATSGAPSEEAIKLKVNAIALIGHVMGDVARQRLSINESRLSENIDDGFVKIDGYDIYRVDRNREGGGVAFYVKTSI